MNFQKILQSYHNWEEYNKQNDIGLMTLYQNEESKKIDNICQQTYSWRANTKLIYHQQILHCEIETELLDRPLDNRYQTPHKQTNQYENEQNSLPFLRKKTVLRKRQKSRGNPILQDQKSVKVGIYDVSQLCNISSAIKIPKRFPVLQKIIKSKKHYTQPTKIVSSPNKKYEESLGLINNCNNSRIWVTPPRKFNMIYKNEKKEDKIQTQRDVKSVKRQVNTERKRKLVNFQDYKMINVHRSKIQGHYPISPRNGKHKIFPQNIQQIDMRKISNRETESVIQKKQHINLIKLKNQTKSLLCANMAEENKLREVISNYFTPISPKNTRIISQSL